MAASRLIASLLTLLLLAPQLASATSAADGATADPLTGPSFADIAAGRERAFGRPLGVDTVGPQAAAVEASAVSEPIPYSMLLAGAGVVALLARRHADRDR